MRFLLSLIMIVSTPLAWSQETDFVAKAIEAARLQTKEEEKKSGKAEKKQTSATIVLAKKSRSKSADRAPAGERNALIPPSSSAVTRPSHSELPVMESPQEEETRLTKNWGGERKKVSDWGLDVAMIYKGELHHAFSGGSGQKYDLLHNLDLRLSFDGEKLLGWKGASAFVYFLHNSGGHPSRSVGDFQWTSNIETTEPKTHLYEAWFQQLFFDDKMSILAGLHDLNSEFYVTDAAGLFFNSSFGVGSELAQTGPDGPSIFPNALPAIRLRVEPDQHFNFQTAAFKVDAGYLLVSEAAYVRGRSDSTLYGKYGLGVWTYTRTFDDLSSVVYDAGGNPMPAQSSSRGLYWISEQHLSESTALFFRYGIASSEVNEITDCLTAGIVFTGLLPGREKDRFGLGLSRVQRGESTGGGIETIVEGNYRIEILPGVALQPDLQFIKNPNADHSLEDAWASAIRLELNF